jgi:hypothetical protein
MGAMLFAWLLAIMTVSWPALSLAAAVGHFAEVRVTVDLSKQGRPPPKPARIREKVEPQDAVRTDDSGKAQIKFIDDSLLTIAPRSQVIIDNYVFVPSKKYRQASLSFFRGFSHILLGYVTQVEQPDFIVNTYTAVLGSRGTGWFTITETNFTDVFCENGELSIKSKNLPNMVPVRGYQATRVWQGKPPLPPMPITSADLAFLKRLLDTGLPIRYDPGNNPTELLQNLSTSQRSTPSSWSPPPPPGPPSSSQTAPAFRGFEPRPAGPPAGSSPPCVCPPAKK